MSPSCGRNDTSAEGPRGKAVGQRKKEAKPRQTQKKWLFSQIKKLRINSVLKDQLSKIGPFTRSCLGSRDVLDIAYLDLPKNVLFLLRVESG